ncbi:D-lyxose/D-mannose family sugar isomerase [Salmonella enterica]|nr:D-lyxose/D-mannose family sugar isomerase [Salmonella enterica]EEL2048496.1 D-lyxose/D-mannose family sugar isomerase [Salmonella enterica]EGG4996932.1 D-lyxose/D-mannose family sugar isomerase [Salmonella enterica]
MKRSLLNKKIDEAHEFAKRFNIALPEFAYFTRDDWKQKDLSRWQEVIDLQLGWDLTDFGGGNFTALGLVLFTLRNGSLTDKRYPKRYAEKMLLVDVQQETPFHFHFSKMEDILNRGGGDLCIQFYHATSDEQLDLQRPVEIAVDGCLRSLTPGDKLVLKPGQGVCIPPYTYHRFWAEKAPVLGWEVSMVNDDHTDNRFLVPLSRFAEIEEDEPMKWVLCNEYKLIKG